MASATAGSSPSVLSVIVTTRPRASPPSTLFAKTSFTTTVPWRLPMLLSRERPSLKDRQPHRFEDASRRVHGHGLPRDVSRTGNHDLRTPVRDKASQEMGSGPVREGGGADTGLFSNAVQQLGVEGLSLRRTVAQRVQVSETLRNCAGSGRPSSDSARSVAVNWPPVASKARHSAACSATRTERVRDPNGPRLPACGARLTAARVTLRAGPRPNATAVATAAATTRAARSCRSRPRRAPGSGRIPSSTR